MTKINGAYVFFGLFIIIIGFLWKNGYLYKYQEYQEFLQPRGGKRKRKPRRKP